MQPELKEIIHATNYHRSLLIQQFVDENKLIKLINDYSQLIDFYYDQQNNVLYKVANQCDETMIPLPEFNIVEDKHILEMNGIQPVSINNN